MNVGGGELVVILAVAVLVLGPKRLPEIARFIGRMTREVRKAVDDIKREIGGGDDFSG
ncbi:MAG: twin-arginine translocase TatA/TatE family subunit [bacterium]|nr:twin-arginine translocase TatA/TatE family subunit [bacterium]